MDTPRMQHATPRQNDAWLLSSLGKATAPDGEILKAVQRLQQHTWSMQRLVEAVQELAQARDLGQVMSTVCTVAREITGADGATFVLREDGQCLHAAEDAISPLWKGMRFPSGQCISGWVMQNREPVVIEDVYTDRRVPATIYRSTFVKSLVMVPVGMEAAVAAIGTCWATPGRAGVAEVDLLMTLANAAAVAIGNIDARSELERCVQQRTLQLETVSRELEAFTGAIAHDLRSPLRNIAINTRMLLEGTGNRLDVNAGKNLGIIDAEARRMEGKIEALLRLADYTSRKLKITEVDMGRMASDTIVGIRGTAPGRRAEIRIQPDVKAHADAGLMQIVLDNLLSNAWKYSGRRTITSIAFGMVSREDGTEEYYVSDNGAGFDMRHADKLYVPFQRLHSESDFPGAGVGLAAVERIIRRHGGMLRAESRVDQGATFFFTLPGQSGKE